MKYIPIRAILLQIIIIHSILIVYIYSDDCHKLTSAKGNEINFFEKNIYLTRKM